MAKVTFLGLGVMGYPMARHIAKAGHDVTVYNRTTTKAEKWVKEFDFNEFPGYQQAYVSSSVDIGKLRPNKSYDFLFENRDYLVRSSQINC